MTDQFRVSAPCACYCHTRGFAGDISQHHCCEAFSPRVVAQWTGPYSIPADTLITGECITMKKADFDAIMQSREVLIEKLWATSEVPEKFYAAMSRLGTPKKGELRRILIQLLPALPSDL